MIPNLIIKESASKMNPFDTKDALLFNKEDPDEKFTKKLRKPRMKGPKKRSSIFTNEV